MYNSTTLTESSQDFLDTIKSFVDNKLKKFVIKAISDYPEESIKNSAIRIIENADDIERTIRNEKLEQVMLSFGDDDFVIVDSSSIELITP